MKRLQKKGTNRKSIVLHITRNNPTCGLRPWACRKIRRKCHGIRWPFVAAVHFIDHSTVPARVANVDRILHNTKRRAGQGKAAIPCMPLNIGQSYAQNFYSSLRRPKPPWFREMRPMRPHACVVGGANTSQVALHNSTGDRGKAHHDLQRGTTLLLFLWTRTGDMCTIARRRRWTWLEAGTGQLPDVHRCMHERNACCASNFDSRRMNIV